MMITSPFAPPQVRPGLAGRREGTLFHKYYGYKQQGYENNQLVL